MSAFAHLLRPDICHPKANDDCDEDWSYSIEAMLKYGNARALAEREKCIGLCETNAAETAPPFKPHEDNYLNGWLDASNACTWAIQDTGPMVPDTGG